MKNEVRALEAALGGASLDPVVNVSSATPDHAQCMPDTITEMYGLQPLPRSCGDCRMSHEHAAQLAWQQLAASHFVRLTVRECQVMDQILAGKPNKNIASDLCISQRTVENHRASIMRKTGSRSLPALSRMQFAATWTLGSAL